MRHIIHFVLGFLVGAFAAINFQVIFPMWSFGDFLSSTALSIPPNLTSFIPYFGPLLIGVISGAFLSIGSGSDSKTDGSTCVIFGYQPTLFGIRRRKLEWDRNTFCRGWLITGGTGCGKTESGINVLVHSLCDNERGLIAKDYPGSELEAAEKGFETRTETRNKEIADSLQPLRVEVQITKLERGKLQGLRTRVLLDKGSEAADASELTQPISECNEKIANSLSQIAQIEGQNAPLAFEENKVRREAELQKYSMFPFGGLAVDEKGEWWYILKGIFDSYKRSHHLCLLQTLPDWGGPHWRPSARFNILSDTKIPHDSYAEIIVKTAQGVEGGGSGGGNVFFVTQAKTQIGWAIALDRAVVRYINETGHVPLTSHPIEDEADKDGTTKKHLIVPPTDTLPNLKHCHKLLTNKDYLKAYVIHYAALASREPDRWKELLEATSHFKDNYLTQAKDQLSGVIGTIANYLNYFTDPEVADVFCSYNTFNFEDVDHGLMICVAMPQKLSVHRRYICTILKLLFYAHAKRRFDMPAEEKAKKNLLVCFQDEAQRFIQEEDGNVDILRSSLCTTVMATQMHSALYAAMSDDKKARVTVGNLRNRLIFAAAEYDSAEESAKYIGKAPKAKISKSTGKGGTSTSRSTEEQYVLEPSQFMTSNMPKFTAVVCHADGQHHKLFVPPITLNGKLPTWIKAACKSQPRGTRKIARILCRRGKR